MKIGFDSVPEALPGTYCGRLVEILSEYAPEHEYVVGGEPDDEADVYHSSASPLARGVRLRGARRVVTVRDLNFLRYPRMYTFFDRMVRLRLYRRSCRSAACVIALSRGAKEELAERLGIDPRKIEVLLPLGVHPPAAPAGEAECEAVRRKYGLPGRYVLAVGVPEVRLRLVEIFDAVRDSDAGCALVVCGRRTGYSDFLSEYARATGGAGRIEFVYESAPADLPALMRMAEAYVSMSDPEVGTSLRPLVEAMRSGVPAVLSDTPLHRETAADAAVYAASGDEAALCGALRSVLCDKEFRACLAGRGRVRSEIFSERAVARRLSEIYGSLQACPERPE